MNESSHPLPTHNIRIKKLKSLLAIATNSVRGGNNYLFRNIYADVDGVEKDILEDGALSCAIFTSAVLLNLELIKKPHATVSGAVKDMLESKWYDVAQLKPGAVIVWEKMTFENDEKHSHIGFYVGDDQAISNSFSDKCPRRHHATYGVRPDGAPVRKIEKIYWHPDLNNG